MNVKCPFHNKEQEKRLICNGVTGEPVESVFEAQELLDNFKTAHCCDNWQDCVAAKYLGTGTI